MMQEGMFPPYTAQDERIRRLEAQVSRLLGDRRIGLTEFGPLPVSDSHMGIRYVGPGKYHLAGVVGCVHDNTRTLTIVANRLYAAPFLVVETVHVEELGFKVASGAAGNYRQCMYGEGKDVYPGRKIPGSGSGSQSVGAAYNSHTYSPPFTLYRGLHWVVLNFNNTPNLRRIPYEQGVAWDLLGRGTDINTGFDLGWRAEHTFGTLPDSFPTTGKTAIASIPIMWVKLV